MENKDNMTNDNVKLYNNKYIKIQKLGMGSYGKVYLVKDKNTGILYSMKKYYFDIVKREPNFVNKIYDLTKTLDHCGFIKCVDTFERDSNHYIVYEYLEISLFDFIKKNKYDKSNTELELFYKAVIFQILEAVKYLHSNSILHRDMKPDNIMISKEGVVKIIDYDLLIKINNENEELSRAVGTLYYKSPEIFFGETKYGYGLDLWSIGCLICEAYLGKPIFEENSEIGVLSKITEILGAPNEENIPGISSLSCYLEFESIPKEETKFDEIMRDCPNQMKLIILALLDLNLKKRSKIDYILTQYEYFSDIDFKTSKQIINTYLTKN